VRLHRRTVERVRVKLSSSAPAASSRQRRRLFELGLRAGRRGVPNQGIRAQRGRIARYVARTGPLRAARAQLLASRRRDGMTNSQPAAWVDQLHKDSCHIRRLDANPVDLPWSGFP
jgi:hypothetical protein